MEANSFNFGVSIFNLRVQGKAGLLISIIYSFTSLEHIALRSKSTYANSSMSLTSQFTTYSLNPLSLYLTPKSYLNPQFRQYDDKPSQTVRCYASNIANLPNRR